MSPRMRSPARCGSHPRAIATQGSKRPALEASACFTVKSQQYCEAKPRVRLQSRLKEEL